MYEKVLTKESKNDILLEVSKEKETNKTVNQKKV